MKARCVIAFLFCISLLSAIGAERPAGQVVWWGKDVFWKRTYSEHTNGVLELGDEILSDAVEISANYGDVIALKTDGTVVGFGLNFLGVSGVPHGLSNVVSVAITGNSAWAIKRDGAVNRWGEGDEDHSGIIDGLTNVTAIAWAGYRSYLALKNDGTLVGFRFDGSAVVDPTTGLPISEVDRSPIRQVKVRGQVLSNVVALASMGYTPLVLKNDGTVLRLGYQTPGATPAEPVVTQIDEKTIAIDMGGESGRTPYHYTSADPVKIAGNILSNVAALASGGGHVLALKSNGTVVALGDSSYGATNVPTGLSNVIAIAAGQHLSLALRRDGTVVAWGGNDQGQTSVPAGLSNVVAIAAGGMFGLAITTGSVPASVYVRPHGRLEEMEREADLVFKGQVLSTRAMTNTSFPYWAKPHATRFRLVSVLKGKPESNEPVLWHYTAGPGAWGGGTTPSWYQFETGQCYLVFASKLERPDYLYSPPPEATNRPSEYRQLYRDCVTRTLDDRPLLGVSAKEAHWLELNRLLTNAIATNSLYAIRRLDLISPSCVDSWIRTEDFKRGAVLKAILPLVTSSSEQVAVSAIGCFEAGGSHMDLIGDIGTGGWMMPISRGCKDVKPECIVNIAPYANELIAVANTASSSLRRAAAIAALSCTQFPAVSNSLPRWLADSAADVRAQAVLLLPDFPGAYCERALRERSRDASLVVRAAVADAIGNGKFEALLPTLEALFSTSPVQTNSGQWPHKGIQGDGYFAEVGSDDVHTSAGYALLKFEVNQVSAILKTNLSDEVFGLRFIRKLAVNGAEPYLPMLARELRTHTAGSEQEAERNGFHWALSYWLAGDYGWAWDTLFKHISAQTRKDLENPQIVAMLDALQIADDPGDARTRALYECLLDKGLIERAKELRRGIVRRTEDKAIDKKSFGFPEKLKLFDEIDQKHGLKPGLGL
ncbi:MAG TPA: hypothetical protein VFZ59_22355 [Verrucomicrobiae bacterium]|nr:hypothetical protein [Verrucomicrobiae bacterium]